MSYSHLQRCSRSLFHSFTLSLTHSSLDHSDMFTLTTCIVYWVSRSDRTNHCSFVTVAVTLHVATHARTHAPHSTVHPLATTCTDDRHDSCIVINTGAILINSLYTHSNDERGSHVPTHALTHYNTQCNAMQCASG
jgi:hypothetical protein